MRLGYFGGTFDPPHRAHLQLAQLAADTFSLDTVLLAPTGVQPLKQHAPEASFADRLAMTRLLCGEDIRLQATDMDAPHADGSPNFTVDALQSLHRDHPGAELFVLVGADSFSTLPQWKHPEQLLELAQWIVMARPLSSVTNVLPPSLSGAASDRVHLLNSMDDPTSATALRERLHAGVSCGTALPPAVMLYISRMHLYHGRMPKNR